MMYFKLISFILGGVFGGFGAWAFWDPKSWTNFLVRKVWLEGNPVVLMIFFFVHLALAMIGWVLSFRVYRQPYAYIVSGFLTLGTIKLGVILPVYKSFRQAVILLLTKETMSRIIFMALSLLLGSGMIFLSILIR